MSDYRLSRSADDDLNLIFWYGLENFGPTQTERYLSNLEYQFDYLSRFPGTARLRTELTPPVRAHIYGAHVIVYEIQDREIMILRIRSGRENWATSPLGDNDSESEG